MKKRKRLIIFIILGVLACAFVAYSLFVVSILSDEESDITSQLGFDPASMLIVTERRVLMSLDSIDSMETPEMAREYLTDIATGPNLDEYDFPVSVSHVFCVGDRIRVVQLIRTKSPFSGERMDVHIVYVSADGSVSEMHTLRAELFLYEKDDVWHPKALFKIEE
jgi:hypothetical protein